jgi:hypothetical protein
MSPRRGQQVGFWDDNFEETAENVHNYVQQFFEDEELEYSEISGDRSEIETGYTYSVNDFDFKFSLAGTFNSDPEILRDGGRKIVLQSEDEEPDIYRELLEDLEVQTGSEPEKSSYDGLDVYKFNLDSPYS